MFLQQLQPHSICNFDTEPSARNRMSAQSLFPHGTNRLTPILLNENVITRQNMAPVS